jgi:hypothetical protein
VVRQYVTENNKWRERLVKLVGDITDNELKLVIYKEGWTIAAALAHLAFWDERRFQLVRIWQQKGVQAVPHIGEGHTDIINDTLLPFFLTLPPRKAADLCIYASQKVDWQLEKLPEKLIKDIEATGDRHALNRGIHRQMHLDEIEPLLKEKRR